MPSIDFRAISFLLSAVEFKQLPSDVGTEVAFVGRSNAGKSSALNVITGKHTARVSKTPGRTQAINVFTLDEKRRLIDLPGYGFAKVSEQIKNRWQLTVNTYLHKRKSLQGLMLVMDSRHPFTSLDIMMLQWASASGLQIHILLTKVDKLNRRQKIETEHKIISNLGVYQHTTYQFFSALTKEGVAEAREVISNWLG